MIKGLELLLQHLLLAIFIQDVSCCKDLLLWLNAHLFYIAKFVSV